MYQIQIYPTRWNLWRWEIRRGGELLYCGTARERETAETEAREVLTIA